MKRIAILNPVVRLVFLTGSILALTGCHAPTPEASPELELPVVEQSVKAAEVMSDGSIRIDSRQLVRHIGTDGVFILSDENRARFRMVKAGKKEGGRITISSGLTGGEHILTGPYDSVYDGSPVRIVENKMRNKQ